MMKNNSNNNRKLKKKRDKLKREELLKCKQDNFKIEMMII